jgi:hypothetical protein
MGKIDFIDTYDCDFINHDNKDIASRRVAIDMNRNDMKKDRSFNS